MYGCRYCRIGADYKEYCALTGEPTNGAVMCDFEWERCSEYMNALIPVPKNNPKAKFVQTSIFGADGEKPF